jgi:hypothetical protein
MSRGGRKRPLGLECTCASLALSPDGQRLLLSRVSSAEGGDTAGPQIVVVTNWVEELKRRVSAR